jgi:hypothetical protein
MDKKLILIDADGLLYASSKDSVEESILIIDEKINNILEKTEATHYALFISQGKYFRHTLFPEYKQNRSKSPTQLKWIRTLRQYLVEKYNAMSMNGVEADDLLAYWYNKDNLLFDKKTALIEGLNINVTADTVIFTDNRILCSPDKDILQSIPGKHFNYTYRLEEKDNPESLVKGWWVETKVNDAMNFRFQQLICGDTSDGIKGIEGKGIKFFESIKDWDLCMILEWYLKVYGQAKGIFEFQKNYRLLHLLDCDEDFIREVNELPELPHINELKFGAKIEDLKINNSF